MTSVHLGHGHHVAAVRLYADPDCYISASVPGLLEVRMQLCNILVRKTLTSGTMASVPIFSMRTLSASHPKLQQQCVVQRVSLF